MNTPIRQQTVAVIGAGRGLGRAAAAAFARAGATVLAVSRTEADLLDLRVELASEGTVVPLALDATETDTAYSIITTREPGILVLVAGATPTMAPLDQQSWQEFSVSWNTDVKLTHAWLSAALAAPLRPGSRVIVISSGAAMAGSPLSGGYAGAKATQRFLADYAQDESDRRHLGITVSAVLPRITPHTNVGAVGSAAYAARDGISTAEYAAQFGDQLTPATFGTAIRTLANLAPAEARGSFLLTAAGLKQLP